jgi:hypothetical protein
MTESGFSLRDGMDLVGLGWQELWLRYSALGGDADEQQIRDHVLGEGCTDAHEHNVIAQAINEAFLDRGQNHPVGYQHTGNDLPDLPSASA